MAGIEDKIYYDIPEPNEEQTQKEAHEMYSQNFEDTGEKIEKNGTIEYKESEKQLPEDVLLNKLDLIYDIIQNNKNEKNELIKLNILKKYLENKYFELTSFPVPYNENGEVIGTLD